MSENLEQQVEDGVEAVESAAETPQVDPRDDHYLRDPYYSEAKERGYKLPSEFGEEAPADLKSPREYVLIGELIDQKKYIRQLNDEMKKVVDFNEKVSAN